MVLSTPKHQFGFRKQNSIITAAIKLVNDVIKALDCTKALFIDLSEASDI